MPFEQEVVEVAAKFTGEVAWPFPGAVMWTPLWLLTVIVTPAVEAPPQLSQAMTTVL